MLPYICGGSMKISLKITLQEARGVARGGRKGRGVASKGSCATFCRSWFSDSVIFVRNLDLLSLQLSLLLLLLPLLLLLSLLLSVLHQRFATTNCIINTKMRTCCEVCHLTEKRKVNKNASPADVERRTPLLNHVGPCGMQHAACSMQVARGAGLAHRVPV